MSLLSVVRMSSKGQVVIPKDVRDSLGLEAGSQFVVAAEDDCVVLKKLAPPTGKDYAPLLRLVHRTR